MLLLPLLALAVVVVDTVLLAPVSAPVQAAAGEVAADQTLSTLLRTTLHETRLPAPSGGASPLFDQPVSQLLAETLQGIGCGTVSVSNLIHAGYVGGDVESALENMTGGAWGYAAVASNSSACGTPVHLDLGPVPPGTSSSVFTSWALLPALGPGYAEVTVGVELWGP
jgi:hypothetical protein